VSRAANANFMSNDSEKGTQASERGAGSFCRLAPASGGVLFAAPCRLWITVGQMRRDETECGFVGAPEPNPAPLSLGSLLPLAVTCARRPNTAGT